MFLTGLKVQAETEDGIVWTLLAPVVFLGVYGTWAVPSGYRTDWASVPRLLWWFTPQSGKWNRAAVVHDWLITDGLFYGMTTSPRVDAEFRHALKACGVGFIRRWLMWAGVRWAALVNKDRRPGWLRTLPLLLLVTALVLVPLSLVALIVL